MLLSVMVSVLFAFFLPAVEPLIVLHLGFYKGRIGFCLFLSIVCQ